MRMNSLTQTLEQWLPVIDPARPMTLAAWLLIYGVPFMALFLLGVWLTRHATDLGATLGSWLQPPPEDEASAAHTRAQELLTCVTAYTPRPVDQRLEPTTLPFPTSRRVSAWWLVAVLTAARVSAQDDRPTPLLISLQATAVALQAYDYESTRTALALGGLERNPVLAGVVGHPVAWGVVKAGVTVGTLTAVNRLWQARKRKTAIGVLVASNVVMGAVAINNARVIGGRR